VLRSEWQIRGNFLTRAWLSARERSRQLEPWENAVVEASHGADPVGGEGKNVEADSVADAVRGA
jgi:hypothetical protein